MRRKHIPLTEKLASLLGPKIGVSYEELKAMTAKQINSRFDWDHYPIRHADGGPDVHWNIFPRLRADHKIKTKHDAADMAKERKVRRAVNEHAQRILLKSAPNPHGVGGAIGMWGRMRKQWPKRKFPTRKR